MGGGKSLEKDCGSILGLGSGGQKMLEPILQETDGSASRPRVLKTGGGKRRMHRVASDALVCVKNVGACLWVTCAGSTLKKAHRGEAIRRALDFTVDAQQLEQRMPLGSPNGKRTRCQSRAKILCALAGGLDEHRGGVTCISPTGMGRVPGLSKVSTRRLVESCLGFINKNVPILLQLERCCRHHEA